MKVACGMVWSGPQQAFDRFYRFFTGFVRDFDSLFQIKWGGMAGIT
jgi:hypothetical protein